MCCCFVQLVSYQGQHGPSTAPQLTHLSSVDIPVQVDSRAHDPAACLSSVEQKAPKSMCLQKRVLVWLDCPYSRIWGELKSCSAIMHLGGIY